jgi:hypothetical protein
VLDVGAVRRQLDEAADEAAFVDLDNGYYFPIDGRIHVFHYGTHFAP